MIQGGRGTPGCYDFFELAIQWCNQRGIQTLVDKGNNTIHFVNIGKLYGIGYRLGMAVDDLIYLSQPQYHHCMLHLRDKRTAETFTDPNNRHGLVATCYIRRIWTDETFLDEYHSYKILRLAPEVFNYLELTGEVNSSSRIKPSPHLVQRIHNEIV